MEFSRPYHSMTPSAFGLAIQVLVFLSNTAQVCPSQQIAKSMKSGTTFMRRVMAPLVRANLVEAREGREGGYMLAQPSQEITVADVYRALHMTDPLTVGLLSSTLDCPDGQTIKKVLTIMTNQAEKSVLDAYEQFTIAEIAAQIPLS